MAVRFDVAGRLKGRWRHGRAGYPAAQASVQPGRVLLVNAVPRAANRSRRGYTTDAPAPAQAHSRRAEVSRAAARVSSRLRRALAGRAAAQASRLLHHAEEAHAVVRAQG